MSWRFFMLVHILSTYLPPFFAPVQHRIMLDVCSWYYARSNYAKPKMLVHYNVFFDVGFKESLTISCIAHIEKRTHKT